MLQCPHPMPEDGWMDRIQDTRLREMWRNCNRCTFTSAPSAKTQRKDSSCSWRKRQLVPSMLTNLLVDDKHRIMYCVIPKVACTNWKRAFVRLSGRLNETSEGALRLLSVHDDVFLSQIGLRYLNTYPLAEIRKRMAEYYKFMFVRHPLERLLSAYRDKFTVHNKWTEHFQRRYGRKIVRTLRRNPSNDSLSKGNDVTFAEFVKYVTRRALSGKALNPHWSSYYDLCHPCSIKYDFVGRFESFERDSSFILGRLSKDKCPLPLPTIKPAGGGTRSVMLEYYKSIPRKDIDRLVHAYIPDFRLFGYDLNFSSFVQSS